MPAATLFDRPRSFFQRPLDLRERRMQDRFRSRDDVGAFDAFPSRLRSRTTRVNCIIPSLRKISGEKEKNLRCKWREPAPTRALLPLQASPDDLFVGGVRDSGSRRRNRLQPVAGSQFARRIVAPPSGDPKRSTDSTAETYVRATDPPQNDVTDSRDVALHPGALPRAPESLPIFRDLGGSHVWRESFPAFILLMIRNSGFNIRNAVV